MMNLLGLNQKTYSLFSMMICLCIMSLVLMSCNVEGRGQDLTSNNQEINASKFEDRAPKAADESTQKNTDVKAASAKERKAEPPEKVKGDPAAVDYQNPTKYLISGKLTEISEENFNAIDRLLNIKSKEFSDIQKVFSWKHKNFKNVSAGGKFVGKLNVNEIIEKMELTGCHDHAIVVGSILRKYAFPVVMVDATGIQWSYDYPEKTKTFSGHVFLEICLKDRWILLDPTGGYYILEYEPNNRVIPISTPIEPKGYYSILKGLDPNDYGVDSISQLKEKQIEYSKLFHNNSIEVKYPEYKVKKLN
ncbi:MAG: hypothetical protein N2484_14800 [Clostridia bacterium]|nr:hypothetical protein [Clostridia bacterium]